MEVKNGNKNSTEKAFSSKDSLYLSLFENSSHPTMIASTGSRLFVANRKARDLLGIDKEEDITKYKTTDFHNNPGDFHLIKEKMLKDGPLDNFEVLMKNIKGKIFWIKLSITFITFRDEKCMLGTFYDISEMKKTQKNLNMTKAELNFLIKNMHDVVVYIDMKGNYNYISPNIEKVLPPTIKLGGYMISAVHEDDRYLIIQAFKEISSADVGFNKTLEYRLDVGGKIYWLRTTGELVVNGDGEKFIAATIRNITDRALISEITSNFVDLPLEKTEEGVYNALGIMGNYLNADRSAIFKLSSDGKIAKNAYEFRRKEMESQFRELDEITMENYPLLNKNVLAHKTIYIKKVSLIEDEFKADRSFLESYDIISVIAIPMVSFNKIWGYMVFVATKEEADWGDEKIAFIENGAKIITAALEKFHAELKFIKSTGRFRALLDNSPNFICIIDKNNKIVDLSSPETSAFLLKDEQSSVEAEGKNISEVFPEDTAALFRECIHEVINKKITVNKVHHVEGKQVKKKLNTRFFPLEIQGSEVELTGVISVDITGL